MNQRDPLTETIIGAAIQVHRKLGPGLLESVYEACLEWELVHLGYTVQRQVPIPVNYENISLEAGFRLDLLVENEVIVELKAVEALLPIHKAQLITYLKLSGKKVGLLINFNVKTLKDGVWRAMADKAS
jgi:GxxExxY protein